MNTLIITKDINVLRDQSAAQMMIKKYATLAKHIVVIVLNTHRNRYPIQKISSSFLIIPTNSYIGFFAILQAFFISRRELFFQGRLQVDVVAAQDPTASAFAGWLIALHFRRPFQIHVGTNILASTYGKQSLMHAFRRNLALFLVRQADALHVVSESTRAALADISVSLADRAVVAKRFMDIDLFQKEPIRVDLVAKYPQFKFIMLVVAPLVRSSNVQLAITILVGVLRVYPYVGLVIVGEGPLLGTIKAQAKKAGVIERVAFENWNDNISSYFKTAHVFLVTAPYEAYEDTIAQAAAASCAIISTKVGIAPSIIEDGETGFLCESDDANRFIASIILMIRKPSLRTSIHMNGMLALQNFMSSDTNEYLRLYNDSLEKAISASDYTRS